MLLIHIIKLFSEKTILLIMLKRGITVCRSSLRPSISTIFVSNSMLICISLL